MQLWRQAKLLEFRRLRSLPCPVVGLRTSRESLDVHAGCSHKQVDTLMESGEHPRRLTSSVHRARKLRRVDAASLTRSHGEAEESAEFLRGAILGVPVSVD